MSKNFTKLGSTALALLVYGCTTTSGVLELGPDTYTITGDKGVGKGWANSAKARQAALTEAKTFCIEQQRELLVTNMSEIRRGEIEIIFRCLMKGDPELVRPIYRDIPDTVIEDRRKN